MINLTFFRNGKGFVGFSCKGHSGYAESGSDIICAAVSTSVELSVAYLDKYHSDKIVFTVDEHDASMTLRCIESFVEADRQLTVLADFAHSLQKQYPKYFTFDFLEV